MVVDAVAHPTAVEAKAVDVGEGRLGGKKTLRRKLMVGVCNSTTIFLLCCVVKSAADMLVNK